MKSKEESEGREEMRGVEERRNRERERTRRKKIQLREMLGKSRNTVFFQWFVGWEGRKLGSLKRRVRSHVGQRRNEKLHAAVAQSTFWSQNVKNTPCSDHFWKLGCGKIVRRCGAKHILKSKCAPLWRQAHFQVKMYKKKRGSDHFWKFGSRKMARSCGAKHISKWTCTKHIKTPVFRSTFDHFWRFGCRKSVGQMR